MKSNKVLMSQDGLKISSFGLTSSVEQALDSDDKQHQALDVMDAAEIMREMIGGAQIYDEVKTFLDYALSGRAPASYFYHCLEELQR